ncbi:MAG: hypothetical protein AABX53_04535 [Nanoarchaeota archaeon]
MARNGQVWVETVVYTLIGLSLIGLVLALVTPKITEYRDRAVIEQTINSLNIIDARINEVLQAPGNTRVVEFRLKQGTLYFNATGDQIVYVLEDAHGAYSEPDTLVDIGRINVLTSKQATKYTIRLALSYDIDINYTNNAELLRFGAASTPYRFSFSHTGFVSNQTATHAVIEVRDISSGA